MLTKNSKISLWLLMFSQVLLLVSSLIDPPKTSVTLILRVIVPIILIVVFSLILAGVISPKKR